jgi:hypothetical protein
VMELTQKSISIWVSVTFTFFSLPSFRWDYKR